MISPEAAAARQSLLNADRAWSLSPYDVDRFCSYFAPDANFMVPGAPIAAGIAAIRAAAGRMLALPGFRVSWQASEADAGASGDIGYTRGTYELTVNDAGGTPITSRGKYLTVWKKNPLGDWKVVQDIFNADE